MKPLLHGRATSPSLNNIYQRWGAWLLVSPVLILLSAFFIYPLGKMLALSLFDPDPTMKHYIRLIQDPIYLNVIYMTFIVALQVTVASLIVSYPLAYFLSAISPKFANLLLILVIIPYLTSVLVRTYAWIVLLGTEGLINQLLVKLGIPGAPFSLMYNRFGVLVGMTYVFVPYMVFSLYSVMRGIDPGLMPAATSLGASRFRAFYRIFLPLSLPGIVAGSLLVFILSLGFFVTPSMMGGPHDVMISMVIEIQVNQYFDWGFASAISAVLLALTLIAFAVYQRLVGFTKLLEGTP